MNKVLGGFSEKDRIEGSLKIPSQLVPEDVLRGFVNATFAPPPVLRIVLPRLFLTDGLVLSTTWETSTIEFDFVGYEIEVSKE